MTKQRQNGAAPMGNQNRLVHGGAAARTALSKGEEFTSGLAVTEQQKVIDDLGATGTVEMLRQGAVRLETVTRLYWGAVCYATEQHDLEGLDRYAKRFGWLQGAALRAWTALRTEETRRGDPDLLDAALEASNDVKN